MYEELDQDLNIIIEKISKMRKEDQCPMIATILVNIIENSSHDLNIPMSEMIETMDIAFTQVVGDFKKSSDVQKKKRGK